MTLSTSPVSTRHFLFFSSICLFGTLLAFPSFAGDEKLDSKGVQMPSSSTNSQIIFINPDTGEIDQDAAASTDEPLLTQQAAPAQEKFTYHADGSVTVDFNGKFMMPVYGQLDENGNVVLSHDQNQGGKK